MITFHCAEMIGRYVDVIITGYSRVLTMCEVEVYASPYGMVPEHFVINQ